MLTKADTRLHFIPIDICHLAVMCSNSLLKDVVYIYSFIWRHTRQSSSRNIPLATEPVCFPSHQMLDCCWLTECGVVCWIFHRKFGFLIVFLSSFSQLHYAIQEIVPYDSIFLPENVLSLRSDNRLWNA